MNRRMVTVLSGSLVVVLAVAGLVALVTTSGGSTRTIRAQFATAPGLFDGNHVDVLGVVVGTITAVQPGPGYATVTMQVRSDVKIPAAAGAYIQAPEVVADRFVQLVPAYAGGPTMPAGSTIPVSRTASPESVDAVFGTLNSLAQQLGPNGANSNGALTSLLGNFANQLRGNGPGINSAITNFSQALGGVAQASPQLQTLLQNLGHLSVALANNSDTYQAFTQNLASVSTFLADDRSNIGSALSNLRTFFANLNVFITENQATLGTSLKNLDTFAQDLTYQQADLAKAFDLTPLALQNLNRAVDPNAVGGPALRARYDPVGSTTGLFNSVCGNSTLRFLVVLATGTETNPLTPGTSQDTLCAVGNALSSLTLPPGASAGPDLSLAALAKAGG